MYKNDTRKMKRLERGMNGSNQELHQHIDRPTNQ